MERIKQALERARAEREEATGTSVVDRRPTATNLRSAQEQPSRETAPIAYTQTQQIELSNRKFRRRRVIAAIHDSPFAAGYKVLRTQVLHRLRLNDWNALAVTSPSPGDGKTLTAVNLAVALAKEVNQTVLLVDMGLRQPSVHTYFDYKPAQGIGDYLLHDASLPDMLFNPGIDGLVVLPGREHIAQSSEEVRPPLDILHDT